ncbi:hypothetical protein ACHHYP_00776 [Achlya hypogyna]|uniref:Uncharacterized protein n=1 Tax=Achlya hypogyna TaxID=1202772 RepID=A0A1V9ZTV7_ACHHY|nr:hypothetical protein ACHHYP_00776 [Achlya hypogyna]
MAEPKADEDDVRKEMKKAAKKASKKAPDAGPTIAATPSKPKTPPAATAPPSAADVPKMNLANLASADPKPVAGTGEEKAKKKSSKKKADGPAGAVGPAPTATAIPATATPSPAIATSPTSAAVPKDDEEEKARQAARREAKRQKQKELEEAKRRKEELERQALELARREEEARQREIRKAQEIAALNANAEECQEEEDYDDDFENYEGDRADEEPAKPRPSNNDALDKPDEETVKKIREAMQAESKSRSSTPTASAKSSTRADVKEVKKAVSNNVVSSSIAGLKQAVDPRAKRVKEVLEKKKFEVEKFDVFHQPPTSDVDKYMQQLRLGAVRQVFVQTNDDARGVGTQTEHGEAVDFAMHFPDDRGNDVEDAHGSSSRHFMRFLERAAHVCEVLAEENMLHALQVSASASVQQTEAASTRNLSQLQAATLTTDSQPLLAQRTLVDLAFSPTVSHWLVTAYGPSADNNAKLFPEKSLLCVWDVNQTTAPVRWLRCEGSVSCCNLGPNREMFVLAGSDEGDVQLWDLRQPVAAHFEVAFGGLKLKVAPPSYSTAGLKYTAKSHAAPICSVAPIPSGSKGTNFQIGSLDDRGLVIVWSIVEWQADATDGLALDSCVEIGGQVRLVKTNVIDTAPSSAPGPIATLLAFVPTDSSQFLVGTTTGKLVVGSRFDKKLPVKVLASAVKAAVTSAAFSPFLPTYLLAGYADGSVRLFDRGLPQPLASWAEAPPGTGVAAVQWSASRAGVFFVLYTDGDVGVWDLLASHMSAVLVQRVGGGDRKARLRLSVSADMVKTCRPMLAVMAPHEPNQLLLLELSQPLTLKGPKELSQMQSALQGVI